MPLKCKIRLDRLRVDGLNLVEIDGKKKQFKIVQKYIPSQVLVNNIYGIDCEIWQREIVLEYSYIKGEELGCCC